MNEAQLNNTDPRTRLLGMIFDLRWFEVLGRIWNISMKIIRGLAHEGIYEVLEYECQLELKDTRGKLATVRKREHIRYAQDYITSFQDQAWGDGEILLDYRCSPGVPVDQYRLGHKTYKLLSLREFKNRGDSDEFNIEWKVKNGFLKSTGFWGTAINHRTQKAIVKVIFPKDRPPLQVSVTESNLQRTYILGKDSQKSLLDGKQMVIWEKNRPRLYENYTLKWEW